MSCLFVCSLFLLLCSFSFVLCSSSWRDETQWSCAQNQSSQQISAGVVWNRLICNSSINSFLSIGPLVFNILQVNLSCPSVRLSAAVANYSAQGHVEQLFDMAEQDSTFVAGINGGFFWELNSAHFFDDVCLGKTRSDASQAVSTSNPQFGTGDTLVKINNQILSRNCESALYAVPIALVMNGTATMLQRLPPAGEVANSVQNAICASPNLVSFNWQTRQSYVDIPAGDFNPNILQHAANTGVGIVFDIEKNISQSLYLVTVDGHDNGNDFQPTSGIDAHEFAHFFKYYLGVSQAMLMDQGGSTTMYIKGQPKNGIVSCADTSSSDGCGGVRAIFSGIFVSDT